jgi:predicted RNA-binding protein
MDLIATNDAEAWRLLHNEQVTRWHEYISDKAISLPRDVLLFVPCAKAKPYLRPTKSFFYNWLWRFLEKEKLRNRVFLCTVSEPFALFPETDYGRMPNYELSPSLLKNNPKLLELYTSALGESIAGFLIRNADRHKIILAYVRPDSTHALFLEKANQLLNKSAVRIAVSMADLGRIRHAHQRMWHLNWMIYLESRLTKVIRKELMAY